MKKLLQLLFITLFITTSCVEEKTDNKELNAKPTTEAVSQPSVKEEQKAPSQTASLVSTSSLTLDFSKNDNHISKEAVKNKLFNLDLLFVENKGQVKRLKGSDQTLGEVKFSTQAAGACAFFGQKGILFTFYKSQLNNVTSKTARKYEKGDNEAISYFVNFINANKNAALTGIDEKITKINYLIGNDPEKHITNIGTYGTVQYKELYPGIDLKYYSISKQLKYDYVIRPNGDINSINMAYSADGININKKGELEINSAWGKLIEDKPYAYQNINGRIKVVTVEYKKIVVGKKNIGFKVTGEYDKTKELIIDPGITLQWSTYFGSTAGGAPSEDGYLYDMDIDNAGNIYTTGWYSSVFPATAGAYMTTSASIVDAYAMKLDPTGTTLIWATYLGGGGVDRGWGIRVDASNQVYVAGGAEGTAPAFPTTVGAFQTIHAGGTSDVFLSKLNATGSALLFSTFIGGSNNDEARGIDIDAAGNTYITGLTNSTNYKLQGAIQTTLSGLNDAFVTKVNSGGATLGYSTYLGGDQDENGLDIVVDASGFAYVTGYTGSTPSNTIPFPLTAAFQGTYGGGPKDAFVTKLNAAGSTKIFSTYLGGGNIDIGNSIRLTAANEPVVGGTTYGASFPLVANLQPFRGGGDGFVTKYNAAGSSILFSTPYGGTNDDNGLAIVVKNNLIILKGAAMSNDITTTVTAYQATKPAYTGLTLFDLYIAVYDNTSGSYALTYATYFGGSDNDYDDLGNASMAINASNCLIVGATTHSLNLPVTAGVYEATKNTANNTTPDQPFVFKLCNIPLPVTLVEFEVEKTSKNTILNWVTATEKNNDYFVVEKSLDGINFYPLGTVKGIGNSSSILDYSFIDTSSTNTTVYYQLNQVDFNGAHTYSKILVLYPQKAETITIRAEFINGTYEVSKLFESSGNIDIVVIDALGRVVYQSSSESNAGSFQKTIDLRKFATGVYIIHALSGDENKVEKIVLNH